MQALLAAHLPADDLPSIKELLLDFGPATPNRGPAVSSAGPAADAEGPGAMQANWLRALAEQYGGDIESGGGE